MTCFQLFDLEIVFVPGDLGTGAGKSTRAATSVDVVTPNCPEKTPHLPPKCMLFTYAYFTNSQVRLRRMFFIAKLLWMGDILHHCCISSYG